MKEVDEYIEKFFQEKEVQFTIFEIPHKGNIHLVESDLVIKLIKDASEEEKKTIRDTLRKIDFMNGNVNH